MPQLEESDERTLVTITVGGNDLLSAFANRPRRSLLEAIARDVAEAYEFLLDAVRRARPNALILLTTIYDPSDRLGRIPGVLEDAGALPLQVLDGLNERIRTLARGTPGVRSPTCTRTSSAMARASRRRIAGTGAARSSSRTRRARARSGACGATRSTPPDR